MHFTRFWLLFFMSRTGERTAGVEEMKSWTGEDEGIVDKTQFKRNHCHTTEAETLSHEFILLYLECLTVASAYNSACGFVKKHQL